MIVTANLLSSLRAPMELYIRKPVMDVLLARYVSIYFLIVILWDVIDDFNQKKTKHHVR